MLDLELGMWYELGLLRRISVVFIVMMMLLLGDTTSVGIRLN